MTATTGARLSVSTWSLHRTLGRPPVYGPEAGDAVPARELAPGALPLLELPARLAGFGIHTLEICHFHLPSRDAAYLAELRGALASADVELFSLLIDAGDITDPSTAAAIWPGSRAGSTWPPRWARRAAGWSPARRSTTPAP